MRDKILSVLEEHESLAMDDAVDRQTLAAALVLALAADAQELAMVHTGAPVVSSAVTGVLADLPRRLPRK